MLFLNKISPKSLGLRPYNSPLLGPIKNCHKTRQSLSSYLVDLVLLVRLALQLWGILSFIFCFRTSFYLITSVPAITAVSTDIHKDLWDQSIQRCLNVKYNFLLQWSIKVWKSRFPFQTAKEFLVEQRLFHGHLCVYKHNHLLKENLLYV